MIHGIGEGMHKLFMESDEPARLVAWVGEQRGRIWTAPMVETASRVATLRKPQ